MSEVYVVTAGEYSDYRILAIFSTPEAADKYVCAHNTGENPNASASVEEWPIDEVSEPVSVAPWQASIVCDTGDISWTRRQNWSEVIQRGTRAGPEDIHMISSKPPRGWIIVTSYVSEEHAKKLAVEARQKWLRNNMEG